MEDRRRHLAEDTNAYGYIRYLATKVPEVGKILDDDETEFRALQEENPNFLTTLTLNFIDTVFEDCFSKADTDFVEPAIVTSVLNYTVLNFDRVVFRNIDYGTSFHHPITAAIWTSGPSLSITDSCFVNTMFLARATVLAVGFEDITTSNVSGTVTENLICQFLGVFPNSSALVSIDDYACIEYDATECSTQPPDAPTLRPVSAPVQPPMKTPTEIPTESGGISIELCKMLFIALSVVPLLL